MRQLVAAAVLLSAARPPLHRFTWKQWWPALLLGGTIALMNICLYVAIQRIGLGLAVTLEFLGPLAIALTRSRSRLDLLCAVCAGVGVYVLVLPGPSSDYLGIGIAVAGAACWAAYIMLNRVVGRRLPGLQGPAAATLVSMVLYLPVAVLIFFAGSLTVPALLFSVLAGGALFRHPLRRGPRCAATRAAGLLRRVYEHQSAPRSPFRDDRAGADPRPARMAGHRRNCRHQCRGHPIGQPYQAERRSTVSRPTIREVLTQVCRGARSRTTRPVTSQR